jgi:hypothetical protein
MLDSRARRAALLTAAGCADADVCTAAGITADELAVYQRSPLWQMLVERARGLEPQPKLADVLMEDAPTNVRFLREVRDGLVEDTPGRLQTRLRAAQLLLDRQVASADQRANAETAARIVVEGRLMGQILHAMRETGVLDVTPEAVESVTQGPATAPAVPAIVTPEDYASQHEKDEP